MVAEKDLTETGGLNLGTRSSSPRDHLKHSSRDTTRETPVDPLASLKLVSWCRDTNELHDKQERFPHLARTTNSILSPLATAYSRTSDFLRLEPPTGVIVTQKHVLICIPQPLVSFSPIPARILVTHDIPQGAHGEDVSDEVTDSLTQTKIKHSPAQN